MVAADFIATSAGAGDSGKGVKLDGDGLLDVSFLPFSEMEYKSGVASRGFSTASGDQVIAHGLGKTPKKVRISAYVSVGTTSAKEASSMGSYDGTNNVCVYVEQDNNGDRSIVQSDGSNAVVMIWGSNANDSQKAVITVDGTNITLAWVKVGTTSTVSIKFMWEVEG